MILNELVKFSNKHGSNPELVLAGGGNTSAKDGNYMYIKGSGTRLATITADGFVKMDREKMADIFSKTYPDNDKEREALSLADLFAAKAEENDKRPSVETTLHSLFEYRYVLHLHPALVNGLSCSLGGQALCNEIFGDSMIWIEPCRPGYILATICKKALDEYKEEHGSPCCFVMLANHGIFIADDEPSGLEKKLNLVMETLSKRLIASPDFSECATPDESIISAIKNLLGEGSVVLADTSREAMNVSACPSVIEMPFTPDHIVYCKAYPLVVDDASALEDQFNAYKEKNGFIPKVFVVKNKGVYVGDMSEKNCETAFALCRDAIKISVYTRSFGGARYMSAELTDFIVNWEAEAYRSKQQ